MAPTQIYHDQTTITNTELLSNTSSSRLYIRLGHIRRTVTKPEKTKEMKIQERANKLHKKSFVSVDEIKPNVFKINGYPFKKKPNNYHRNYALK